MGAEFAAFLLLAAAGIFQAAFAIPMKHTRNWRWEHVWVGQSVTANVVFPLFWAALTPREFWTEAIRLPASHWLASYGWGLLWGIGGVSYGLALSAIGMAFTNAFIFGVSITTGTLLPLALKSVDSPAAPWYFSMGLMLCVLSTALLGAFTRQKRQKPLLAMPVSLEAYWKILAVAMVSGLLSAGYGLAFAFQYNTLRKLAGPAVSPLAASLAILLPVYLGGASVAIPTGVYFARRSGALSMFFNRSAGRNWILAGVMGLCAAGTAVCYNLGSTSAGHPPPNISFAIFMTFLVLGGVVLGFLTGETRNRGVLLSACGLVIAAWLLNVR